MIPMVLEIFLPCYFGNELALASSKLSTDLFGSDWIDGNAELKSLVKIFMETTKKPTKVSAFGIFHVNLVTFTTIINSAYSYYSVLKRINGK
jgi:hypothetical protein